MFGLLGKTNPELSFTKKYFKKLRVEVRGLELLTLKELEIKTKHNGNEMTHFLHNAYFDYTEDKENRDQVFERYINSTLTLYKPKSEFYYDKIVPIIKDWRYVEELKRIHNVEIEYIHEKYNNELFVFYAQDTEYSIHYLVKNNIREFKIETEGLRKRSIENLLNLLPKIECNEIDGYYMLTSGGNYEASLILDNSIWFLFTEKINSKCMLLK